MTRTLNTPNKTKCTETDLESFRLYFREKIVTFHLEILYNLVNEHLNVLNVLNLVSVKKERQKEKMEFRWRMECMLSFTPAGSKQAAGAESAQRPWGPKKQSR